MSATLDTRNLYNENWGTQNLFYYPSVNIVKNRLHKEMFLKITHNMTKFMHDEDRN